MNIINGVIDKLYYLLLLISSEDSELSEDSDLSEDSELSEELSA